MQPKVVAHTAVNRGPILRVRVGLNSADPLVTRVVIDLSTNSSSQLEPGASSHELRVVIRQSGEVDTIAPRPGPAVLQALTDASWCRDFAARVDALLGSSANSTATGKAAEAVWVALQEEAQTRKAPQPLERVHFMLLQSVTLARIAASGSQRADQAAAARSGARLLLDSARARLAEMR